MSTGIKDVPYRLMLYGGTGRYPNTVREHLLLTYTLSIGGHVFGGTCVVEIDVELLANVCCRLALLRKRDRIFSNTSSNRSNQRNTRNAWGVHVTMIASTAFDPSQTHQYISADHTAQANRLYTCQKHKETTDTTLPLARVLRTIPRFFFALYRIHLRRRSGQSSAERGGGSNIFDALFKDLSYVPRPVPLHVNTRTVHGRRVHSRV